MSAKKSKPTPSPRPGSISKHKQPKDALQESQQLFHEIFHSSPAAIVISRLSDGCFVQANQSFLQLTGYTLDEVIGLTSTQAGITSDPRAREARLAALRQDGRSPDFEVDITRKSGEVRHGLATAGSIVIEGEEFALSTFIDITERKRAERQLAQMKRLYATLSQVNQTIMRVKDRDDLFQSICDVAAQFGEFSLASVSLLDETSGDVNPVAAHGLDVAHWPFPLANIHQGDLKDSLSATAVRTGQVVTSEDILTDERTQPSRALIEQFPYHSSAAVPFRLKGKTIGVALLVAREVGLFKAKEEVHLLDEIGLDISFALDTLETEAERKKAEAAREQLARIVDASEDAILSKTLEGVITSWNRGAQRLYGYSAEEAVGKSVAFIIPPDRPNELTDIVERIRSGEYIEHYETIRVRRDGKRIWVSITVSPILGSAGEIVGASTIARDVTERKSAERQLAQMKRLYATLSQINQMVVRVKDRNDLFQSICDVAAQFGEFSLAWAGLLDEASGEVRPVTANGLDVAQWPFPLANIHQGHLKDSLSATAVRTGQVVTSDDILTDERTQPSRALIEQFSYHSSAAVPFRLRGKNIGVVCLVSGEVGLFKTEEEVRLLKEMGLDISFALNTMEVERERREAEERLKKSEERYRSLFEHMIEGYAYCRMIYVNDQAQDWIYVSVNTAFENLTGLKDITGKRVSEVIPGIRESDPQLFEIYSRAALGGRPEKFEIFVAALQEWFSISVYSPEKEFFVAVFDVITERKQAEEALKASEKKYRLISENSADVIWTLDLATKKFTYVSPSVFRLSGLTPEEIMAQPMQAAITPASCQKIEQVLPVHLAAFLAGDESARTTVTEVDQLHKDGSIIPTEAVTTLMTDSEGQVVEVLGVSRDITERKRAEEAVLENERQMRALVTSLDDIVFEFDEQGIYLNVWTADESLLTHPKTQLLGRPITEMWGEENGRSFAEAIKRVVASRRSERLEYPLNVIGGLHWFLANISPVIAQDHSCRSASMLVRDITERKRAEEKIQNQLERLNTLREIDAVISSSFDMKLSLDAIVSRTVRELKVDAADVLVWDTGSMMLEYRAGQGFRTKAFQNAELRAGEGIAGRCVFERKPVHIRDLRAREDIFVRKTSLNEEKFIGYYCVPLIDKGEVKGVLEIFHRSLLEPEQEWIDFLHTLAGQAAIAIESATLFNGLQRSNAELGLAYDQTIEGWSRALDLRDKETEGHTLRVTELTVHLARAFGFDGDELQHIRRGALLHDIGKLGVPDEILFKAGPLTDLEWTKMRNHPQFAYNLIAPIRYLKPALDIPYCHHEKWDGTGYPRGLKGELIPLAARLFAVVDVWDALRNDRPYRASWPEEKVLKYIRSLTGTHFDPKCVEFFLRMNGRKNHGSGQ